MSKKTIILSVTSAVLTILGLVVDFAAASSQEKDMEDCINDTFDKQLKKLKDKEEAA